MEILAKVFGVAMTTCVVLATCVVAMAMAKDASANTNPCNDGGVASVHMINTTTGESECYDLPPASEHQSYTGAFYAFYGFAPCATDYVLAEDGSCVYNASAFAAMGA